MFRGFMDSSTFLAGILISLPIPLSKTLGPMKASKRQQLCATNPGPVQSELWRFAQKKNIDSEPQHISTFKPDTGLYDRPFLHTSHSVKMSDMFATSQARLKRYVRALPLVTKAVIGLIVVFFILKLLFFPVSRWFALDPAAMDLSQSTFRHLEFRDGD